jgi:TonB family protein
MNPRPIRAVRFTVLLLIFCSVVAAKATRKSVTVTIEVTDGHGARIPNAQAEILSVATAGSKTLVTDDEGTAHLELEPGSYVVIVSSLAFKTVNRHITVDSAEDQRFEFALQVEGCPIPDPCPVVPDQVLAPTSNPAAPYSNSSEGLRQLLNDMMLAAKRDDQSGLLSMIRETEIPDYQNWFTSNFGREKGESWAEPYGRWLAKNEKEFQELLVKLAQMDGEFAIEKMDTAKRYDLLNGPLDGYLASWKRPTAPKGEKLVTIGDFFFVGGKFRWDSNTQYFPFQKPKTGSIVMAKLVKRVSPKYPEEARQKAIQGTVVLNVVLLKDGSVMIQSVAEGDPILSPAAIEAVRQWRYEPTVLNGQPIDMDTKISVVFALTP